MNIKTPAPHLQIQSRKHVVRSIMICLQMLLAITTWSQRSEIPLNTDWQYMPGYTKRPAFVRPVTLPHTWNVAEADAGVKNYYRGEGSYER
ncbi:MAG: hypothetical protein KI790_19680 [Cyclobacteriaceae bacterium]|nr:hypothetical protein [Cyclobacteriaceae bacterium HetDA_MAG_MS6]